MSSDEETFQCCNTAQRIRWLCGMRLPANPLNTGEVVHCERQLMTTKRIAILTLSGALLIAAFALLVYPGLYIYQNINPDLTRTNRFTGVREFSSQWGWLTEDELTKKMGERMKQLALKEDAPIPDVMPSPVASPLPPNPSPYPAPSPTPYPSPDPTPTPDPPDGPLHAK